MAVKREDVKTGTILDYLLWRGDLSFAADPWNDVDSLIMSQVSYANFGENRLTFESREQVRVGDLVTSGILQRYPLNIIPSSVR